MRGWMLMAAPFCVYGMYLVGSGEAERRITYSNGRIECASAARDEGMNPNQAGNACNCVRSQRRRWQSRNKGEEFTGALEARFRNACFAEQLAAPVPLEDRSIVDDVFAQHKSGSDWGADPALPQDTGSDWDD